MHLKDEEERQKWGLAKHIDIKHGRECYIPKGTPNRARLRADLHHLAHKLWEYAHDETDR